MTFRTNAIMLNMGHWTRSSDTRQSTEITYSLICLDIPLSSFDPDRSVDLSFCSRLLHWDSNAPYLPRSYDEGYVFSLSVHSGGGYL